MYLITLNIILSTYACFSNAFVFFNNYEYLLEDLNNTKCYNNRHDVKSRVIEQPLDHFNESDKRTWKMRYFELLDFYKEGGPIYLFIGGEFAAAPIFITSGTMYELAEETNGAMLHSEHRYYGASIPFPDLNSENLVHLSSRQALEDISLLLKRMKSLPQFAKSKVVVVGGSYPGNMAAWMRLLYPQLVDAALSSSAPVLAKKDFYEYLETIGDAFQQYGGNDCYDKIVRKFSRYDQLFQTSAGIEQLKKEENICTNSDMTKLENKYCFFLQKVNPFMWAAQTGSPTSIKQFCNQYVNSRELHSPLNSVPYFVWDKRYNCYEFNLDKVIENYKHDSVYMAWFYQTCTEFGYYQSTSSDKHPFSNNIPVKLFIKICTKLYGPEFNEKRIDDGIKMTNDMYGGLTPNVTKVVFVNGDIDPWHRLGILKDLSDEAPAKLVHGTSHCRDLFASFSDNEEMRETRKYVKRLIKQWIGAAEY